jgi:hypothetical protein
MTGQYAAIHDRSAAEEFLRNIFPIGTPGYCALLSIKTKRTTWVEASNADAVLQAIDQNFGNDSVYFSVCPQETALGPMERGKAATVAAVPGLWVDVDIASPAHKTQNLPPTEQDALAVLAQFPLKPTVIVATGFGFHAYWLFDTPALITNDAERQSLADLSQRFQAAIRRPFEALQWKLDPTADLPRILRLPGSYNHKPLDRGFGDRPAEVNIRERDWSCRYSLQALEAVVTTVLPKVSHTGAAKRTQPIAGAVAAPSTPDYGPADAERMFSGCPFMRHWRDDAATLTEPEWFAGLTNVARCEDGGRIARDVSSSYPGYTAEETDEKIRHALKDAKGPHTCEAIRQQFGDSNCSNCKHRSRAKAPINVGSLDHVAGAREYLSSTDFEANVQADRQTAFDTENLRALETLRRRDRPAFEKINVRTLKPLQISKSVSQALNSGPRGSPATSSPQCPYAIVNDAIVHTTMVQNTSVSEPLGNFWARIVSEEEHDDGLQQRRLMQIEGGLATGEPLQRIDVLAEHFSGMTWVTRQWGGRAIIFAGQAKKEHFRVAIQMISGAYPLSAVYEHVGWRKIGGEWHYLHKGGAIGQCGNNSAVSVQLPGGRSAEFELPDPPAGAELQSAVAASLRVLEVAPDRITVPLLGSLYRAPLNEAHRVDFSLFFEGPSGSQKSELTALAQRHFGSGFSARNLPGNWSSTANALEKQTFLAKDAVFVIDDYAPSGTPIDRGKLEQVAERLFRGTGNASGRGRMNTGGSFRPEYYARGSVIASGEDVPPNHSVGARLFVIGVTKGTVDLARLSAAQADAEAGLYAKVMSAYVAWLSGIIDHLKDAVRQAQQRFRDAAREALRKVGQPYHDRLPDQMASILIGWHVFLTFAESVGAIGPSERDQVLHRAIKGVFQVGQLQARYQRSKTPAERFLDLLRTALSSGDAHVASKDGASPKGSERPCGWERVDTNMGLQWRSRGKRIGWLVDGDLYLEPGAVYGVTQEAARRQGAQGLVNEQTLWSRLAEAKILASRDEARQRNTVRRTLDGVQRSVLHLKLDELYPSSESPGEYEDVFSQFLAESREFMGRLADPVEAAKIVQRLEEIAQSLHAVPSPHSPVDDGADSGDEADAEGAEPPIAHESIPAPAN